VSRVTAGRRSEPTPCRLLPRPGIPHTRLRTPAAQAEGTRAGRERVCQADKLTLESVATHSRHICQPASPFSRPESPGRTHYWDASGGRPPSACAPSYTLRAAALSLCSRVGPHWPRPTTLSVPAAPAVGFMPPPSPRLRWTGTLRGPGLVSRRYRPCSSWRGRGPSSTDRPRCPDSSQQSLC
jgi:hypothetical protein